MVALTVLYTILFFYLRKMVKNANATSSAGRGSTNELRQWPTNLEAGSSPWDKPLPALPIVAIDLNSPTTIPTHRTEEDRTQKQIKQVALKLLCYPILFTCLAMPLAATRLAQFVGDDWSISTMYIGACFYCSSGLCNVLLYTATRRGIISWDWIYRKRRPETQQPIEITPTPQVKNPQFPPPPTRMSAIVLAEDSVTSTSSFHPNPRDSCIITVSPDSDSVSFDWAEFIQEDRMSDGEIIGIERNRGRSGSDESLWFGQGMSNASLQ